MIAGCVAVPETTPRAGGWASPASTSAAGPGESGDAPGTPGAAPDPGHELYGYLPYWEMDDPGIAEHVASLPLTTLALFSVTHTPKGAINSNGRGHPWIT